MDDSYSDFQLFEGKSGHQFAETSECFRLWTQTFAYSWTYKGRNPQGFGLSCEEKVAISAICCHCCHIAPARETPYFKVISANLWQQWQQFCEKQKDMECNLGPGPRVKFLGRIIES